MRVWPFPKAFRISLPKAESFCWLLHGTGIFSTRISYIELVWDIGVHLLSVYAVVVGGQNSLACCSCGAERGSPACGMFSPFSPSWLLCGMCWENMRSCVRLKSLSFCCKSLLWRDGFKMCQCDQSDAF